MTGEANIFRKRFFGGFNEGDVVAYIADLARERNELEKERDKAIQDAQSLAGEVAALRRELEEEKLKLSTDYEQKAEVFKAAGNTFAEFEIAFEELRSEIVRATAGLYSELKKADDTVAKLPPVIVRAGERFTELRTAFEADKGMTATVKPSIEIADEPVHVKEDEPVYASEETPVFAREDEPVYASEAAPVFEREEVPVFAREVFPVFASERETAYKEEAQTNADDETSWTVI